MEPGCGHAKVGVVVQKFHVRGLQPPPLLKVIYAPAEPKGRVTPRMMDVWKCPTTLLLLTGMDYGFAYRNDSLASQIFPVRDTESDPPWAWLGLARETSFKRSGKASRISWAITGSCDSKPITAKNVLTQYSSVGKKFCYGHISGTESVPQ